MEYRAIRENWKQMWEKMKWPFFFLTIIYGFAISGIVRADFKYIDDLGRTVDGYQGWENFSRFVSNFLSQIIHTDTYLTDISPLTQILAVLLMAASSTILLWVFSGNQNISVWNMLCVLPLGISPYFLECFSYRYDSPYMALSVFASIFPILFWNCHWLFYMAVVVAGSLVMCMTYQAASGIYPVLIIFYALVLWGRGGELKTIVKKTLLSAAGYLGGMGYFKLFIMVPISTYVTNTMFPLREMPQGIFRNLKSYYQLVRADFRMEWLVLMLALTAVYVVLFVGSTKRNKAVAGLLCLAAVGCGYALAFGMYPALTAPLRAPRGMYGFGALLAILAVSGSFLPYSWILRAVSIVLSWNFFVFAFAYGNMLAEQKDYTMMRMEMVLEDVNELLAGKETVTNIKIAGGIGHTPVLRNAPEEDSILRRLVPRTFGADWSWSQAYFFRYPGLKNVRQSNGDTLLNMNLPVIKDTMLYTIYGDGENMVIELRQ